MTFLWGDELDLRIAQAREIIAERNGCRCDQVQFFVPCPPEDEASDW